MKRIPVDGLSKKTSGQARKSHFRTPFKTRFVFYGEIDNCVPGLQTSRARHGLNERVVQRRKELFGGLTLAP
jgi:hypothetical protein